MKQYWRYIYKYWDTRTQSFAGRTQNLRSVIKGKTTAFMYLWLICIGDKDANFTTDYFSQWKKFGHRISWSLLNSRDRLTLSTQRGLPVDFDSQRNDCVMSKCTTNLSLQTYMGMVIIENVQKFHFYKFNNKSSHFAAISLTHLARCDSCVFRRWILNRSQIWQLWRVKHPISRHLALKRTMIHLESIFVTDPDPGGWGCLTR